MCLNDYFHDMHFIRVYIMRNNNKVTCFISPTENITMFISKWEEGGRKRNVMFGFFAIYINKLSDQKQ